MDIPEKYYTINSASQGLFRDRGSKFISFAVPVKSVEEVKDYIDSIKLEHHSARHHCYAYLIGADRAIWKTNDDGEPSGTAGRPILGQINSNNLTNILIVVVRYFGGTLLGVSGLINAYKSAAADAIKNADVEEKKVKKFFLLEFPYSAINDIMKIIKDCGADQYDQVFEMNCRLKIAIDLSVSDSTISRLGNVKDVKISYIDIL